MAGRLAMERKIRELGDKVDFWVDKDKRMAAIRRKEAKELEDGQKAMEASKSQAQIAWDQHEQVSKQLKAVQAELAGAKDALEKEQQRFAHHRRADSNFLLEMNHGSLDIVREFTTLGVSSPPVLMADHSTSFARYPGFLKYVALLISGIRERVGSATRRAGEQAVRQVITRLIAALHRRHPQVSLLSELETPGPEAPLSPDVSRQVEEILECLSREDDP